MPRKLDGRSREARLLEQRQAAVAAFVAELAALECEFPLSPGDVDSIEALVKRHELTIPEFMALDDRPGAYGRIAAWHPRLRQMRNQHTERLFAALRKES